MARDYTNIYTAIWRDKDFLALYETDQRTYLMLISQAELSSCGTLPVTLKRWASYSPDSLPDRLSDSLFSLENSGFIVVDWDLEELLVRTFIRHDKGYGNPKRLPSILSAAHAVASTPLRQVIAYELDNLKVIHQLQETPWDGLSDRQSHGLSDSPRSVVTLRTDYPHSTNRNPHSANLTPPSEPELPSSTAPPSTDIVRSPFLFDEFWTHYPRKVGKDAAKKAWGAATKKAPAADIAVAAKRCSEDPNLPETQYIPHPQKWLNEGRWADGPLPDRRDGRNDSRPTTDDKVRGGLELAARLRAQEDADEQNQRKEISA